MIKAASVGLGWWSDELARSIQGKSKKIKIVSCYSRSKKKRINFSKKFKTKYHNSYSALINDQDIDAVILTTPHSLHAKHAILALRNGKHVFVEKPMATNTKDAKKIYDYAYKKKLPIFLNQSHLYDNKFLQFSKYIKEKTSKSKGSFNRI